MAALEPHDNSSNLLKEEVFLFQQQQQEEAAKLSRPFLKRPNNENAGNKASYPSAPTVGPFGPGKSSRRVTSPNLSSSNNNGGKNLSPAKPKPSPSYKAATSPQLLHSNNNNNNNNNNSNNHHQKHQANDFFFIFLA